MTTRIKILHLLTLFSVLYLETSLATITGESCENIVKHLNKKKNLKITYVLGYKDARPARFVGDRYEKNTIVTKITSPCSSHKRLCDFKRTKTDAYLFYKIQDGKKLQLRLINSSATEDDDENREHPFQKWKSKKVKSDFLASLSQSDILFYNGHSRSGGGPDFSPPYLKKDNQVDFSKYKNNLGSFPEIMSRYKKTKSSPSVLGLFSCNSTQHFEKSLHALKKNVLLLTAPNLIYFKDALDESLESLELLLNSDCINLKKLLSTQDLHPAKTS